MIYYSLFRLCPEEGAQTAQSRAWTVWPSHPADMVANYYQPELLPIVPFRGRPNDPKQSQDLKILQHSIIIGNSAPGPRPPSVYNITITATKSLVRQWSTIRRDLCHFRGYKTKRSVSLVPHRIWGVEKKTKQRLVFSEKKKKEKKRKHNSECGATRGIIRSVTLATYRPR